MELLRKISFTLPLVFLLGVTHVTASFESAKTFQDCITALLNAGEVSCQVATPYTKCAIRTLGLTDALTSDDAIQQFKTGLNQGFTQAGLSCDVDVKAIVDELKAEGNGRNSGRTSTTFSVVSMAVVTFLSYFTVAYYTR